jgi:hypothetical protein
MGSVRSRRSSSLVGTNLANIDDPKLQERVRFNHGSSLLNAPMRDKLPSTLPIGGLSESSIAGAGRSTLGSTVARLARATSSTCSAEVAGLSSRVTGLRPDPRAGKDEGRGVRRSEE